MNLTIPIEDFNKHHVFFEQSVKNMIIDDSIFIKIIYSNNLFVLNNLYLSFKLNDVKREDHYKKRKIFFSDKSHSIIRNIMNIEKMVLYLLDYHDLEPIFSIKESIDKGFINCVKNDVNYENNQTNKLFKVVNNNKDILLKISGIWASKTKYGLIYKFIDTS